MYNDLSNKTRRLREDEHTRNIGSTVRLPLWRR